MRNHGRGAACIPAAAWLKGWKSKAGAGTTLTLRVKGICGWFVPNQKFLPLQNPSTYVKRCAPHSATPAGVPPLS